MDIQIQKKLDIKEDNQNIRIINSYEQSIRENKSYYYEEEKENEIEIKNNCEIKINNELIPFSYFHQFNKKGKYTINLLASLSVGAPALKYGDVNIVTPSPGEVKGLIIIIFFNYTHIFLFFYFIKY